MAHATDYFPINDELTLLVVLANTHRNAFLVVPSRSSERIYCVGSLRDDLRLLEDLKRASVNFRLYQSAHRFVRSDTSRWRSLRIKCTGCGRHLRKHT